MHKQIITQRKRTIWAYKFLLCLFNNKIEQITSKYNPQTNN